VIAPERFLARVASRGIGLASGVPCSYLAPLLDQATTGAPIRYVPSANEGDAVAVAAGGWLGGTGGLVLMQNSGLGNAMSPLTSLNEPFRIPVLLVVTWRGEPGGPPDEPQHRQMGAVLPDLFALLGIPATVLPIEGWEGAVDTILDERDRRSGPVALLVRKDTFAPSSVDLQAVRPLGAGTLTLPQAVPGGPPSMSRRDALRAIRAGLPADAVIVATTGHTGRELYALGDRDDQLYLVGSMGCASSVALGIALARPDRRVVCLDGDGAVLMRMGALATIGAEAPPNLLHVVLDNGCHDSTGAQPTVTCTTDLAAVAAACGYRSVERIATAAALSAVTASEWQGPSFLHVPVRPGTDGPLPRPTVTPAEVSARFRRWLA
jgi:phosphonopyruvate decarboxylase